jgi:parallel beta-helix repeat protein
MNSILIKSISGLAIVSFGLFLGNSILPINPTVSEVIPSGDERTGSQTSEGAQNLKFERKVIEVKNGGSIQLAVKEANPGDLIKVYPGTYSENVYIDKDDITLQGVVINGEWPTLDGKRKINDAILYSGNGITIDNFKIINYKGNGIMGQAGNNFIIRNNWIIDTGVYGIFPQLGKNGLIEHNVLSKIADAAIYVGMSDNVDVIHNEVFDSVAGIEIENSRHCLVENNYAHDNTGGLLAFVTPGLPIKTTFDVIMRNNFVVNNNHVNFGAPGSTVSSIPAGTGILIMAADDVILENNIISGNQSTGVTIVDLATGAPKAKDPNSEGNPDRVVILDNIMYNNGSKPEGMIKQLMLSTPSKKGLDILAFGGGTGSTIKDKTKYVTFGLEKYGPAQIADTKGIPSMKTAKPVPPRAVTKEQLGEITYYGVCAGCHAIGSKLIGVPTEYIQMIHKGNPQGIVDYINNPKNLRDDYPDMPTQKYLSEEAKMAVAEYILALKIEDNFKKK